jgi:hypothetical protein
MGRKVRKVIYVDEDEAEPATRSSGYWFFWPIKIIFYILFRAPGKYLLAFDSFGSRNISERYISEYRKNSAGWQFIKSIAFWFGISILVELVLNADKLHQ